MARPSRVAAIIATLVLGAQIVVPSMFVRAVCFAVGGLALWWGLGRESSSLLDESEDEEARGLDSPHSVAEASAHQDILVGAGHDLRQPVQAIALFAASLAAYPLPEAHRKLVAGIESGVQSLSGMLEAIFGIAKLRAGRMSCQIQRFSLEDALRRAVDDKLDLAHEHELHLRHVATARQVQADPALLNLALGCMLGHALALSPREEGILLGCRRRGGLLWIELRHRGTKVSAPTAQELFVPGEGYCDTLTDKGYGLAYVEGLARLMDGTFSLQAWPGRGCLLRLSLPAA